MYLPKLRGVGIVRTHNGGLVLRATMWPPRTELREMRNPDNPFPVGLLGLRRLLIRRGISPASASTRAMREWSKFIQRENASWRRKLDHLAKSMWAWLLPRMPAFRWVLLSRLREARRVKYLALVAYTEAQNRKKDAQSRMMCNQDFSPSTMERLLADARDAEDTEKRSKDAMWKASIALDYALAATDAKIPDARI